MVSCNGNNIAPPSDDVPTPTVDNRILVVTLGGRQQIGLGSAPVCVEFGMVRIKAAEAKTAGVDDVLRTIAAACVRGAEWVMRGDGQAILVAGKMPPEPPPQGRIS